MTLSTEYSASHQEALRDQEARIIFASESTEADRPDYKGDLWVKQHDDVVLVRDVYGGTKKLREEGKTYLPSHPKEDDDEYETRKNRAILFNAYKRTVEGMTGMVFRKDLILNEDIPERILSDLENVDLQGRDLSSFAKDVLTAAVNDGHTIIHIDAPTVTSEREVSGSKADVAASGRRPYWVHVLKDDLVNIQLEIVNGAPVVMLAVYREEVTENVGEFGQRSVERYRELRPGEFRVWEKGQEGDEVKFTVVAEGRTSVPFVPLVPVYANRIGFYESAPPLLDLAYENIEHYQVRSDHRHALTFASIPLPVFVGVEKKELEWGPNRAVFIPNESGDAKMLESNGKSLEQSRQELADIEMRMAALGLSMLVEQQSLTATERIIDKAEGDSALAATAKGLQGALGEALRVHGSYLGLDDGGSVVVNEDFESLSIDPREAEILLKAVERGVLTRETFWLALQKGELLPEDFDPEEEAERLASQGMGELEALAGMLGDRGSIGNGDGGDDE